MFLFCIFFVATTYFEIVGLIPRSHNYSNDTIVFEWEKSRPIGEINLCTFHPARQGLHVDHRVVSKETGG